MATLSGQITILAQTIGADVKKILANQGDLESLTTTQKASLVLALNELKSSIDSVSASVGAQIDDESTDAVHTWSGSKINTSIQEAVTALVNGAPKTMDTLKELADALQDNEDALTALQELAGSHVRYDQAQSLEPEQQTQARTNIGAAAAADVGTITGLTTTVKTDLVSAVNEVKAAADQAQSTAKAAQSVASAHTEAISTLTTNVGDTQADFAAQYVAARDGE